MRHRHMLMMLSFALVLFGIMPGNANALQYDELVTFGDISTGPTDPVRMLYGSSTNGGFTVDRRNGVELGLRAQLRFDANNHAQNIYNSNGDGTYSFPTGTPNLALPHPDWATTTTPIWSIVFSANTDYEDRDDTPSKVLADFTFEVGIDFDPVATNNWLRVDPISATGLMFSLGVPDHAFGLYSQQSTGIVVTTPTDYVTTLQTCNIAQNTANVETFNMNLTGFGMGDYSGFDPNQPGVYNVYLAAFLGGVEMARTEIQVWVGQLVPVPSVLGTTQQEAQDALVAADLVVGAVTEEYSSLPAGTVISQYPPDTEGLPPGSAVSLVISKGEAPKVPAAGGPALTLLCAFVSVTALTRLRAVRR